MTTIYLKKHNIDGQDYLVAEDVFEYVNENTKEGQRAYQFSKIVQDCFNYWNDNTPTAFGNPEYNYLQGAYVGYITAMGWGQEETKEKVILKAGNRKVWVIDKIEKPDDYYRAMKDNTETLNAILR